MSTKTTNYNFTKPAENEYYDVNVQNDNWDKADDALTKKVTAAGGDIANTIVSAIDASTASFPVPAAKDKPRTFLGKIKKWQEDCIAKFGNYVLKSMISSQQINDSSKVPSSALAYLMQQAITENANDISVLNTKQTSCNYMGNGIDVNAGDDLDNYLTPGVYRSTSWDVTQTLGHIPNGFQGGFRLEVFYRTSVNYLTQILHVNGEKPRVFIRIRNAGIWSSWTHCFMADNIQMGVTAESIEALPGEITIFHIDFDFEFYYPPNVVATLYSTSESINYADLTLTIYNVTTTGFDIHLYNRYTTLFTPKVSWMAACKITPS